MKQTSFHLFFYAYKTFKRNFLFAVLCFTSCLSNSKATCIFSNCGNTGRVAPTAEQINTASLSTNLNGNAGLSATGIQARTVSFSGLYRSPPLVPDQGYENGEEKNIKQ